MIAGSYNEDYEIQLYQVDDNEVDHLVGIEKWYPNCNRKQFDWIRPMIESCHESNGFLCGKKRVNDSATSYSGYEGSVDFHPQRFFVAIFGVSLLINAGERFIHHVKKGKLVFEFPVEKNGSHGK
uniref:Uncharacterized protein n=1 Tax=Cacopsylla melanoneura TaxID=428564 RepID=A0A8D8U3F3_9HEMI